MTGNEPDRPIPPAPDQIMLAEYAAIRDEVERGTNLQWNVFALQITTAGLVTSFALSSVSNLALLLLIPLTSYMLGSRYILHDSHIKLISRYIQESLSVRLHGQLEWDTWKEANRPDKTWTPAHPTRLAFEGIATLTLVAAALSAVHNWFAKTPEWYLTAGFAFGWLLGLIATYMLHRAFERPSRRDICAGATTGRSPTP